MRVYKYPLYMHQTLTLKRTFFMYLIDKTETLYQIEIQ